MIEPAGRVILVSGASRGIGRAVAAHLLRSGYRLSLGLRDPARTPEGFEDAPAGSLHRARYVAEDWTTHDAWVNDAVQRFGRIDGLVCNAGVHSSMTLRNPDEAELDRLWSVNCKAPLNLIHCALPHLEKAGAGRIITLASLSGKRVRNDLVAYNMSKFATIALTHAARRIAWDKGVRATAICPSFVATDMTAGATLAAEAMSQPEDIAALVATVLALPNNAAMAEVLVNCRLEDTV